MTAGLFARRRSPAVALAAVAVPLVLVLALAGCGEPPDDSPQRQVQERLSGTWLREYVEAGVAVRRVLVLEPDGVFRESSVAGDAAHPVAQDVHEGQWSFDGTNLKRRYTLVNGHPPSRLRVPFATFELRFESPNQFTGIDRVHHREVVYRRVDEGTQP